ncbi:MAG: hypothetical protein DRO95_06640 [Candidatus Altiarchaeales archaeon]|nr:MAG: hypothetical protein DRO95_06640 [Candidatus Altiarchaeales archaeon]
MAPSTKKKVKCPTCGAEWHIDTKLSKRRTLTCPNCKRVDFLEYFIAPEETKKKEAEHYRPTKAYIPSSIKEKKKEAEKKAEIKPTIKPKVKKVKPKSEESFSLTSECFIVTATYGTDSYEKLSVFYDFRDNVLAKNSLGRIFIRIYYLISPYLASLIRGNLILRRMSVIFLDFVCHILQRGTRRWKDFYTK